MFYISDLPKDILYDTTQTLKIVDGANVVCMSEVPKATMSEFFMTGSS
jgi:hypothetical protein